MSGTYVLVVDLPRATTIDVGALGAVEFAAGTYAYVGSAFGPGGFARVDSRRSEAPTKSHSLRSRERHWHIDYLLGHPGTTLETAITFPGADRECELADRLPGNPVAAFGASDCDCSAHLLAAPGLETVRDAAVAEGGRPEGE